MIFGGPLSELYKSQSLLWSVENQVLALHLEKVKSSWWKKLLEFEPEINLSKIDHSQPISELSEQAKAKIDEILYKQELKDKGQFTRGMESGKFTISGRFRSQSSGYCLKH